MPTPPLGVHSESPSSQACHSSTLWSAGGSLAASVVPAAVVPAEEVDGPVVRIRGMRFEPHELEVAVGDTVTWINEDAVTHTVTSGQGTVPTSAPLSSSFLPRGGTYQFRFEQAGDYEYLCLPHLDQAPMRGARVRVVGNAP